MYALIWQTCCNGAHVYNTVSGYECCGDQYVPSRLNADDVCCGGQFYTRRQNYQCCADRLVVEVSYVSMTQLQLTQKTV